MQKNENETTDGAGSTSKIYEVGYLLVPSIAEEDLAISYNNLKDTIVSFGGEVISDDMPKSLNLSYPMQKTITNIRNKFHSAYFGWIKFSMSASKVLELKKNLDLNLDIIRFLILKTVRENTIATKKFVRTDMYKKTPNKKTDDEVVLPINKEEIDKEIDAMVSV